MNKITSPHDKFFKQVFTRGDAAKEFLMTYLPPAVVRLIDWGSLEYTKDSFIDKDLNEFLSDLLFMAQLKDGSSGYVYVLFEHKSYHERLTAFHILRYMVKIWEMLLRKHEVSALPVIIPLVLYHGERIWKSGLNFRDLFDCSEEMASFVPNFEYLFWGAAGYSDEEIKGQATLRVGLLLMKYIFSEDLRDRLPGILGLLKDLSKKRTGMEYIEAILRYIVNAAPGDNVSYDDIKAAFDEALPHTGGGIVPTIADSLIQQGMQQGIQQGIQQGKREGILEAIELGLTIKFGTKGLRLLPAIQGLKDARQLETVKEAIKASDELTEIEELLKGIEWGA